MKILIYTLGGMLIGLLLSSIFITNLRVKELKGRMDVLQEIINQRVK